MKTFVLLAVQCFEEDEPPGLAPYTLPFLILLSAVLSVCSVGVWGYAEYDFEPFD